MKETVKEIIRTSFETVQADIPEECLSAIGSYFEYLLEWNTKINLISRKSPEDVLRVALIESYSLYEVIRHDSGNFLDVGSGGGLPGMIIAILMPEVRVELLDATRKKTDFLTGAAERLGMKNVKITNARLEDIDRKIKYDVIFSRGVGKFDSLKKYYFSHIDNTGRIIMLTGEDNSVHFRSYDVMPNPFLEGRIIANLEK